MGGRTTVTETVSVRKVGVLYRSTIRAALVRCLAAKRRKVSEIDIWFRERRFFPSVGRIGERSIWEIWLVMTASGSQKSQRPGVGKRCLVRDNSRSRGEVLSRKKRNTERAHGKYILKTLQNHDNNERDARKTDNIDIYPWTITP